MDDVFRALADPSRRLLLDRLFERDGQTLTELASYLEMSRFGVMKHLRILEGAGLVATRKVGREKFHYLNPVPIRSIHDRWVDKYTEPLVAALSGLKAQLEATDEVNMATRPRHVYEVYIRTTPEKLWEAITKPEFTRRYFHLAAAVESAWLPGAPVLYKAENGCILVNGTVLEVTYPRKLVYTWRFVDHGEADDDRPSRLTWQISPVGEVCKLTLMHDDFDGETKTYQIVGPGWNPVLSGLKTLMETGEPLLPGLSDWAQGRAIPPR